MWTINVLRETMTWQLCVCLSVMYLCFVCVCVGVRSRISECKDCETETVMQLRSELRDKEMKLTDIRLEALSSAHQLDQLRDSMNRMQVNLPS